MASQSGTPSYFARANLYASPIKPELPITYETAEKSKAFYVFALGSDSRISWAEKWLVFSEPVTLGNATKWARLAPGRHFFKDQDDRIDDSQPEITLESTRGLDKYIRVEVSVPGRDARMERIVRKRTLRHDYEYWDNGALRRIRFVTDVEAGEDSFDEHGKLIAK